MPRGVKVATSNDIFLSIDGKRIAGVQSYSTKMSNETKFVDAFGHKTPIGYTVGKKNFTIDLTRVFLEDTSIKDGIDFYALADADFQLVIDRNGKIVTYSSCIVSELSEDANLNDTVQEKMQIMALERDVSEGTPSDTVGKTI